MLREFFLSFGLEYESRYLISNPFNRFAGAYRLLKWFVRFVR